MEDAVVELLETTEVVAGLHVNVNGETPPAATTDAVPLHNELQLTSLFVAVTVIAGGEVILNVCVRGQALLSKIETV